MRILGTAFRRGVAGAFAACALTGAAAGTVALPSAAAADPCTASGLATTASGVLAAAGTYLDGHPEANGVLTAAGTQPADEARSNVTSYFLGHPGEFVDLQNIVGPLRNLRSQCGVSVTPTQLATLFDTLS
jgi:hemophore-related protein